MTAEYLVVQSELTYEKTKQKFISVASQAIFQSVEIHTKKTLFNQILIWKSSPPMNVSIRDYRIISSIPINESYHIKTYRLINLIKITK